MMAGLAAAMAAPKRVVRDPKTNKVAGVEPVLPASQLPAAMPFGQQL
jgi:hypothetical protein